MRTWLLKLLARLPYFSGRDRAIDLIARSFAPKPTRLADGLRLQLNPYEWLQLDILTGGPTEPKTLALITSLVKPGDVVIDVGAHVGHHALVAARSTGPSGRVFAFDPQPQNLALLIENAQLNGLTWLVGVCGAVGDWDGLVTLSVQDSRDRARLSLKSSGPSDDAGKFQVAIQRLDSFAQRNGIERLALMKIDVEGFEAEVLRGAGILLSSTNNIILELLDDISDAVRRDVLTLLRTAGFGLQTVDGRPWSEGFTLPEQNIWAARRS